MYCNVYVSQIRHVSSLLELSLTHDNPSLWLAMHCNVSLARIMFWCWTVLRLGIETEMRDMLGYEIRGCSGGQLS